MLKITGTCEGAPLGKRFYMPGVVMSDVCPKCGAEWEEDLAQNYIQQYSDTGKPFEVTAYCNDECGHKWKVGTVVVRVTLEVVESVPGAP